MAEQRVLELESELQKMQDEVKTLVLEKGKLDSDLGKTKEMLDMSKHSQKTVYISRDRKLQKFSSRPVNENDPTVEEWIDDATQHLKCITSNEEKISLYVTICRAKQRMRLG